MLSTVRSEADLIEQEIERLSKSCWILENRLSQIYSDRDELYRLAGFEMNKIDFAIPMELWNETDHLGEKAAHAAVSYYGDLPEFFPSACAKEKTMLFLSPFIVWDWMARLTLRRRMKATFLS